MFADVPLWPEQASTVAARVDALMLFMLAVTGAVGLLVTVVMLVFVVKYRRRVDGRPTPRIVGSRRLEWFWTLSPLAVFVLMFAWGASVYCTVAVPPADALDVYV